MNAPRLTDQDLQRARQLIRQRIGIELPEGRSADLRSGLEQLSTSTGLPVALAIEQIQARPLEDPALGELISVLTINETHFFRNEPQFRVLRSTILPELLQARRADRRLRIWSAACSSGEEPYSAAMLLRQLLPEVDRWNIHLLGTDIDEQILEKARAARYGEWSFRQVPKDFDDYFQAQDGQRQVVDEVRRMVSFQRQNLVDVASWNAHRGMFGRMDLIFCRNVLIYFNGETTQRIIDGLYQCLAPGGWLLVGHAEPSQERFAQFITHTFPQTIIYQRPPDGVPAGTAARRIPHPNAAGLELTQVEQLAQSRPDEAIRRLQAAVGQPDPAGRRQLLLARLLAGRRRLREAAEQAALATQLAGLSPEAHYVQGTILRELGESTAALEALRRAVFLDKSFVLARVQLAEAHADLGQPERARRELQQAEELLAGRREAEGVFGDAELTVGRLRELIGTRLRLLAD